MKPLNIKEGKTNLYSDRSQEIHISYLGWNLLAKEVWFMLGYKFLKMRKELMDIPSAINIQCQTRFDHSFPGVCHIIAIQLLIHILNIVCSQL